MPFIQCNSSAAIIYHSKFKYFATPITSCIIQLLRGLSNLPGRLDRVVIV